MGKRWKEAKEKTVNLPKDDPEAFALYSQLVYTGRIPGMNDNAPERGKTTNDGKNHTCSTRNECEKEYRLLCGLYVLAEKMIDSQAKNHTIEALYFKIKQEGAINDEPTLGCLPSTEAINIMYDGTAVNCSGRKILVWSYMSEGSEAFLQKTTTEEDLPSQFLQDLVYELMLLRRYHTIKYTRGFKVDRYLCELEDDNT
jgi:hypothetical protein